jgi:hypothetical protein
MRFLHVSAAFTVFTLVACGGASRPQPPAAPPTTSSAAVTPATTPTTAPKGPTAESCDGIRECASVGIALAKKDDKANARLALGKACTGAVRSIDACAVLSGLAEPDADPTFVADAAHNGCNVFGAEDGERDARAAACATWGSALRDGKGTDADEAKAVHAFEDGCKLGSESACDGAKTLRARAERREEAESGVQGANLHIGSATLNGVTVEKVACRSNDGIGGLFGSIAVGKPFADKKRALDACAKGAPHKTRVRWTSSHGKMTEVKVISGDDPSNRCIERALTNAPTTVGGTCAASVDVGAASASSSKAKKHD